MALLDVTDAFGGITQNITVNVPSAGHRDHGMWVDGQWTPHDINAVVQPMSENEINLLNPDGDSTETHLKFYIDTDEFNIPLETAGDSKTSVTVIFDGGRYKALKIKNYGDLGGFRLIFAVLTKD